MKHPPEIIDYLGRIYSEESRTHACRAKNPDSFQSWQSEARPALQNLLGLECIARGAAGHNPSVELDEAEDLGKLTRRQGFIETEPDVRIHFWLVQPKGDGPFPLAVAPHGHGENSEYAGIGTERTPREKIEAEDRDVAIQAAQRGFLAIAPATRGIAPGGVTDISKRHCGRNCRSHFMHALLAGRTAMGERVWDMMRIMDWASALPEVDARTTLMLGNSGGGMVTTYTAACDTRVRIAMPSCSYNSLVGEDGLIHHCDCNGVPGILQFGEFWDIAALIAPRHLITVNGSHDSLHPTHKVDAAVKRLRDLFAVAGVPERYEHKYGDGGHRFYKTLFWPFVDRAVT
jgi:dienelactone hydrolase